jgi:archaellum biogenesis ATPase FlaH
MDYIKLDSLEEVEINDFTGEDHQVKILKLLLLCKDISASRIVVNISRLLRSLSEGTCQRIRDAAHPGSDIKFNVWLNGRWEPYA